MQTCNTVLQGQCDAESDDTVCQTGASRKVYDDATGGQDHLACEWQFKHEFTSKCTYVANYKIGHCSFTMTEYHDEPGCQGM